MTTLNDRRFSERLGRGLGGNADSGPFQNVPSHLMRTDYTLAWRDFAHQVEFSEPGVSIDDNTPVGTGTCTFGTNTGTELIITADTINEGYSAFQSQFTATGLYGQNENIAMGVRVKMGTVGDGAGIAGFGIGSLNYQNLTTGAVAAAKQDYLMFIFNEGAIQLDMDAGGTQTTHTFTNITPAIVGNDTYVDLAVSVPQGLDPLLAPTQISVWYKLDGSYTWKKEATIFPTTNDVWTQESIDMVVAGCNVSGTGVVFSIDYMWYANRRLLTT